MLTEIKRKVDVLINNKGELSLSYKEGGICYGLRIYRNIREERLSKGWTVLKVIASNKGWTKLGSFVETIKN